MEKDFTTNGTEGSLRCPFSNLNHNRDPDIEGVNGDLCGHGHVDPIKAELGDRQSSAPSGSQCPVSRCPIRFLDQHSPEEIADYVERHKHEIPRSHAVCVQRYGRNSQTMRRMDAKYGGLTNMITGLGEKHQAFLPGHQNGAPSSGDWADDPKEVHSKGAEEGGEEGEREEREGHFDRPLREVRVGESPSRPWGIPVPITADPVSAPHSQAAPVPGSDEKVDGPGSSAEPFHNSTKGCPFGHGHGAKQNPETETVREGRGADQPAPEDGDSKPGVVFNGPVFFGYTAEQTAGFLQQLSSSIP